MATSDAALRENLARAFAAGRPAQGYLIVGPVRREGRALAEWIGAQLLGDGPTIAEHAHPDMPWFEPEKVSRIIGVDMMRGRILPLAQQSALSGGWKVLVIVSADRMRAEAANAFLKTLEEPPPQTLFLLLVDSLAEVLPTIVSRCQVIQAGGTRGLDEPWRTQALDLLAGIDRKSVLLDAARADTLCAILEDMEVEAEKTVREEAKANRYVEEDADTIKVVDDVLHNNTNKSLVDGIAASGGKGVTISGKGIMRAEKLWSSDPESGEKLDIGFVGKVISVDVNPILDALRYKFIPVITPLAMDFYHQPYNINADTAACEIAKALKARKLVFLSDVPGVLRDPKDEKSLISVIKTSEVGSLIADKVLTGGMLPKIQSSVEAIKAGTKEVHMVDGRIPHSLLLEIFTNSGIGTEIIEG